MALQEQVEADIKSAMKQQMKDELTALRAIKSAILLALTEKNSEHSLTEEAEMKMLTRMAKQRKESAEIYSREGRADLADKELFELTVIERYLPEQMSEEDIRKEVERIVSETGASSMKDMGRVMGEATKVLAGKADGKVISGIVREILA